jgi:LPS-assembly protein
MKGPNNPIERFYHRPSALLLALTGAVMACAAPMARAQEGVVLRTDLELRPASIAPESPLFVAADRVEAQGKKIVEAWGSVEARRGPDRVFADYLRYDMELDEVQARGGIRLQRPDLSASGDTLTLRIAERVGRLDNLSYEIPSKVVGVGPGRGEAAALNFQGPERYALEQSSYTTCPAGGEDWHINASELAIDRTRNVGSARHAWVEFLGVPFLYSPWLDFSLTQERKSGVLAPSLGTTDKSGIDVTVPYYLNLAPNMDATLIPRLMSKRGLQLGGEYRYLARNFGGEARLEYLARDQQTNDTRFAYAIAHQHRLSERLTGYFNLQHVSDDNYFRDLSNQINLTSQTILPKEGGLAYTGEWFSLGARAQKYQTLQDPLAPVTPPYDRLPQITLAAKRDVAHGFNLDGRAEYIYFEHPTPTQTDGQRLVVHPGVNWAWETPYAFVRPRAGVHFTRYALDRTVADDDITRTLPTFSLDSGLTFERPFTFGDLGLLQTLEPRAYYVYIPYQDQSAIPVFDSAATDLSFMQMFTENQFSGDDRINDANQVTLALTSRFLEAGSGLERLRATIGQRFYFSQQRVTLPGTTARTHASTDLLLSLAGQITPALRLSTDMQYDSAISTTVKSNLSARYQPGPGRVLNASYRFIDNSVEQIDLSTQWPLTSRWWGLARYNYSLTDDRVVEALAGIEYNKGCWLVRGVFQRIATSEAEANTSFFIQLELAGMGRVGSNPLDVLQQSIPGYAKTSEY